MGVIVIIEEVDHGRGRAQYTGANRLEPSPTERPTIRSIGRGRSLLEDFPAAVGVAEAALERARPGHGRFAGDAADAEDLDVQALPDRRRPVLAGLERCGSRTSSDSLAAAPANRPPPPAGRGNEAQPRAHAAGLGPWRDASRSRGGSGRSAAELADSALTTRSGRTPCWRRPCGGRSRGG